ncbi:MAG: carbohydrate binding family 9 domain-containing protein [Saprospiraceae bacterium]|nr:carbohydrate binding family 9 domain-containing protein [Saprospiraceae bacterium]
MARLNYPLNNLKDRIILLALAALFSLNLPGQNAGLSDNKTALASRLLIDNNFQLDGLVNENFWMTISPISEFHMREPIEGGTPTERSEVRIAFDEENIYLGIILYDSEPDQIKAFLKKRDEDLDTEDSFTWFFDTYLDGRNAYMFSINPLGLKSDGLLTTGQGSSLNKNWDGIWYLKTHIGSYGWSAEVKIPFRTLNFDKNSNRWGVNFQRVIRRKNEEVIWTGHRLNQGIERPQDGGVLEGLTGISQGIGLEAKPFSTLKNEKVANQKSDTRFDAGLDVNYNITPNLKASFTLNTDFAETEVDDREINLTRFPLQFPEKRDFFLEGAGIYSYAPRSGINPYFSRRIGLQEGRPIPISYGARLLGRIGQTDLALLQVRTGETDAIQPEDFTVLRLKQNIGSESTIGIYYTRRSTQDGSSLPEPLQDRHTVATDLEWNTSRFLGDKNLQFQAFLALHNSPSALNDETDVWDRSSRGIRFNYPNRPWFAHCSYREFGTHYNPAVGFNPRNGFRRVEPAIGYAPLFEKSQVIRSVTWRVLYQNLWDLDFKLLTQLLRLTMGDVTFESGERASLQLLRTYERLESPFDILRDGSIIIPVDEYIHWTAELELGTAPYRKIVGEARFQQGGFWGGDRTIYDLELTVRPLAGLNLSIEFTHTAVDLDPASFKTDLFQFEGGFDITPEISFFSIIQYDNLSKEIGMNHRFHWIVTPGTDVFAVFNYNWLSVQGDYRLLDRSSILKINYTHRF